MYIFLLIILLFIALLDILLKKNFFVYFSAIILAIIAGIRGEYVGIDTEAYINDYNAVLKGFSPMNSTEFGFVGLEKIFSALNFPVWLFLLFISILTFFILCYCFVEFSGYFAGLVMAYYYARFYISRDFNQIRSSLSAALILVSLKYVKEKKLVKFIFIILIGNLIHSGTWIALVIYPSYFFIWKKLKSKILILYPLILSFFIILSQTISPILEKFAQSLDKGSVYITSEYYTQGSGLSNPVMWMQIFISLIAVYLGVKFSTQENENLKLVITSYIFSTLILVLFNQYRMLGGRLSTMFATVEPLVVLFSLNLIKISKIVRIVSFICIIIIIFILINYIGGLIPELYPYYISV